MSFNVRLKQLRQASGLSQIQVSAAIGISGRAYQYFEYGQQEPSIAILVKLANYFKVSADYLLGLSDDPKRR